MRLSVVLAVCLLFVLDSSAQIIEGALSSNPVLIEFQKTIKKEGVLLAPPSGDTLDLPFLDDFSYEGPYPSSEYWLDKSVYINNSLGLNPPSIGVASFDGLQENGFPYGGGQGVSDYLTSKCLRLAGLNATDDVYLSFYYQAKGLGDRPLTEDSLVVEFLGSDSIWYSQQAIAGLDPSTPTSFIPNFFQIHLEITNPLFFYDGFQFRFKNHSNNTGAIDHWNIDYVRVTEGEIPDEVYADIAMTELPPFAIEPYTAMPWDHFVGQEDSLLTSSFPFHIYNHDFEPKIVSEAHLLVKEEVTGTILHDATILDQAGEPNIANGVPTFIGNILGGSTEVSDFQASITGFSSPFDEKKITTTYYIVPSNQSPTVIPSYTNDTVSQTTNFERYFAYDDGTAEGNLVAQGISSQIAVKYTANKADTIRGIHIHFPHINGSITNQLINLKVWIGELSDDPDYQETFLKPIYAEEMAGFTTYAFEEDLIEIPEGDFFVGWQMVTAGTLVPVGMDKQRDASEFVFFDVGNGWDSLPPNISGALMLRPIMGNTQPVTTNVSSIAFPDFKAYPNPASQEIFFDLGNEQLADLQIEMTNLMGQIVKRENAVDRLTVGDLPNGMYLLTLKNASTSVQKSVKISIQH